MFIVESNLKHVVSQNIHSLQPVKFFIFVDYNLKHKSKWPKSVFLH